MGLTPTSYAILGQLALRDWTIYEMTKNVARTLHWFWPRAESVLYAECKHLAGAGLARSRKVPGKRGRDATSYGITRAGRRALAGYLRTEPDRAIQHNEALLRVHLAPWGTKEDLLRTLDAAKRDAEDLTRVAVTVGTEFAEGRHQFQDQVHIRAALFDYLWTMAQAASGWADRWHRRVERWSDIDADDQARTAGVRLIASRLAGHSGGA